MDKQLTPIEYKGQRILMTSQLSESYGTDDKRISENFSRNKDRYKEGKHYFFLEGEELKGFKAAAPQIAETLKFASALLLWTEKGAWLHAKSLNTDRAWEAYETLMDDYYSIKDGRQTFQNLSPELQAIFVLDHRTQEAVARIERLENNSTIDHGQQQVLRKIGNKRIVNLLGGKDASAYQDRSLRSKTYSAMWNDFQEYFGINSYNNTLLLELERAKAYIPRWSPATNLLMEIEFANNQMSF